jgi:adenine specific DNA methylase Mod
VRQLNLAQVAFTSVGQAKDDAVNLLQTPSAGTLIPCPEESINFESTGNVVIEGDNLKVLKLLFKPYFGRVKLIYIGPHITRGMILSIQAITPIR